MQDQPHAELSPNAVALCLRHVRRAILLGEIAPGQNLPPERQLAVQLGVNRTTLRAALAQLEATGLIAARQGSGTVVQDFRRVAGPGVLPELLADRAEPGQQRKWLDDLLLVRRQWLAAVLARLVAGTTPRVRGEFAVAVAELARCVEAGAGPQAVADADRAVWTALAHATGSLALVLAGNPVADALRSMPDFARALAACATPHLDGWLAVSDWLVSPDPAQLATLLQRLDGRDALLLEAVRAD